MEIASARRRPWQEGNCAMLAEYFKHNIVTCPAHSECVLAQYLIAKYADVWDNIPSLSYFGVAEPRCHACSIWL